MKTQIRIFAMAMLLIGISISTFAQVSATASGSAKIVTPISIANAGDMNFGNVAVSSTAGTVVLTPDGSRAKTGGVTLPAIIGTVSVAKFNVAGVPNFTYSITLPSTFMTITDPNSNTMTVDTWTSSPTVSGTLDVDGKQTVSVGATLNVAGSQVAGVYSGTFSVTVNYM